jgi:phosphoribosylformylglycinamidine synthase
MIRSVRPRVAVVHLPGMNCEFETVRALAAAGLDAVLHAWDDAPDALRGHDAYVLPGGFSYQDRVRAGAVAAKDPRLAVIAGEAAAGRPVLGICNGAQILVEAGLVPGDPGDSAPGEAPIALALAENHGGPRDGYDAGWVVLEARGGSLWTEAYAPGERVPMPMAHGEGRFTARREGDVPALAAHGEAPYVYASADGPGAATRWPDNPNGAQAAVAGMTNRRGNVLALMPHPERADRLWQLPPDLVGAWGERRRRAHGDRALMDGPGPGHGLFVSLAWHLGVELVAQGEGA